MPRPWLCVRAFGLAVLALALPADVGCRGAGTTPADPRTRDASAACDAEDAAAEADNAPEPPGSEGDQTDGSAPNPDAASESSIDASARDASAPDASERPRRVLFVGNSYTEVNNLPAVVAALANATRARTLQVESVTMGGAKLADHWMTTGARERIATGGFDVVVLQGQSQEPLLDAMRFEQHASLFAGLLREVGAQGVWFATWAPRTVEGDPRLVAEALERRYRMAAAHNGDALARVGAAWQIALLQLPNVALHQPDGSHPSAAGTLLAGCIIAQALIGQVPRLPQPPPLGVAPELAEQLCAIAEAGVRCSVEKSFCGQACIDWSVSNCGDCGITCRPGDPCRRGRCGCDEGQTGCAERCTDLGTDPRNCGKCGKACPVGAVCKAQTCQCPSTGVLRIARNELAALYPGCPVGDGSLACNGAAHDLCTKVGAASSCFRSGFGPPSGHAPQPEAVMCVDGMVHTTSYTALRALVPGCDGSSERLGQSCSSAIHRFCVSTGAVSGFGPLDSDGDQLRVTCLASATVLHTSAEQLRQKVSRCTAADPVSCSSAAWNYCESQGYASGFGPVEASGDERDIVCLEP